MSEKYSYVKFRWTAVDLDALENSLSDFYIERKKLPTSVNDLSPYRKYREYLIVKSDTLTALAHSFRVIISQKEKQPFTSNDMMLRKILLEKYPKKTSSFFPWGFTKEPSFEIEKDENNEQLFNH